MKTRKKYQIIIEDESRLERLIEVNVTRKSMYLWGALLIFFSLIISFIIIAITPLKSLIPGFMPDSRRTATEEAILRVDSLREEYRINQIYFNNLKYVMDTDRAPADTARSLSLERVIPIDSVLPRSGEEAAFAKIMQEREKFNISVLSKMAAEGMLLFPVSDEGVVTTDSRDTYKIRMIIPDHATIMAVADGVVLAEYFDQSFGRNVIIVQHDNGFVSKISGLGSLYVGQSDQVNGGEVISAAPHLRNKSTSEICVELWHNGLPVKPYDYIFGRKYDNTLASSQSISNGIIN